MNRPHKDPLIAELERKHPYTPFSEELKHMVHTLGNVEGFDVCEISPNNSTSLLFGILAGRNCVL